MKLRSRTILCLFIFLAFFAGLSDPAAGVENVSRSPGLQSLSPRIAIDSIGNLHVVWGENIPDTTQGNAYYSKYDIATRTWSTPLNLSNNGRVFSEEKRPVGIAIDGADNIYVVYVEKTRISMRIFSGGSWGAPFILASWNSGHCDSARVGVDPQGNIFTSWWILETYTVYSRARIDGVWEEVQVISAGQSKFSDIAVGANAVFACWSGKYNTSVYQIFYVRRSTTQGASWTTPKIVYPGSHKQQAPAIEVDANDIAHVVFTPAFEQPGMRIVRYARWNGTGFDRPVNISPEMVLHYPSLDEQDLNIYTCWQIGAYGAGLRVDTNNNINGVWGGVNPVPDSAGVTYCDVAVNPLGLNVFYVWDGGGEIWCNMGATAGGEDNEAPTAEFGFFIPGTAIFPVEITFDASDSSDPDGRIVQYSWNFGDGGRASGRVVSHTFEMWGTFPVTLTVLDDGGATASRVRTIEILRLHQPLEITWQTHKDESLFQVRHVTQVTWARNPANDDLGVQIMTHRVWRKKTGEVDAAYRLIGEVSGGVYSFMDKDAGVKDDYVYTVTVLDGQGHESPIVASGGNFIPAQPARSFPSVSRRGKLSVR